MFSNNEHTILIVSQPDSIHTKRFITAVREHYPASKIYLYPSNPFPFHEQLKSLCDGLVAHANGTSQIPGNTYYRHIASNPLSHLSGNAAHLAATLQKLKPNFIHVNCIQDGGYLLSKAIEMHPTNWDFQISLTVWGNDLFRYSGHPVHAPLIKDLLKKVDVLMPECHRDVSLARKLGFNGRFTKIIQATLTSDTLLRSYFKNHYGTEHGHIVLRASDDGDRASNGVAILGLIDSMDLLKGKTIYYLGEVVEEIRLLEPLINSGTAQVEIVNNLPQKRFFELLKSTRIYISLTNSDGLPNAFLECCASRTYPVFSICSAVDEWLIDDNILALDPYDRNSAAQSLRGLLSGEIDIGSAIEKNNALLSRYNKSHITDVVEYLFGQSKDKGPR